MTIVITVTELKKLTQVIEENKSLTRAKSYSNPFLVYPRDGRDRIPVICATGKIIPRFRVL